MILVITLNPTIIKTLNVQNLMVDTHNEVSKYQMSIGDCGVYSAYIIKILQGEAYVIGFAGGIGGRYIKNFLDKNRIRSDFNWKEQETRSSIVINDTLNETKTILTDKTMLFEEQDYKNFKHKFHNHVGDSDVILLNGDSSNNILEALIEEVMQKAQNQIKVIAAIEGKELKRILERSPYALVVGRENLEDIQILEDAVVEIVLESLRKLLSLHKVHYMIFNDVQHVYAISRNKICRADFLAHKDFADVVGLKSAIVGGVAISVKRKYEFEKMLKMIMAIKYSVDSARFPEVCTRKEIDVYMNKVRITEIYNSNTGYHQALLETKSGE